VLKVPLPKEWRQVFI